MSFFFNDTATTEIYTLSLHDALPIYQRVDDEIVAFAVEDNNSAVKEAAASSLLWTGSDDALIHIVNSMEEETFEAFASKYADEMPVALRPRTIDTMRKVVKCTTDHTLRLTTSLNLIELGEQGLDEIVKDSLAALSDSNMINWGSHYIQQALRYLRKTDSAWLSEWETSLVEHCLEHLETEDLKYSSVRYIIEVMTELADANVAARVFTKLRKLRLKMDEEPGRRHQFDSQVMRQLEDVFRCLPDDIAAEGILSSVTNGVPLDIKVTANLLSRVARTDKEPLHIADEDLKARLRAYLKSSVEVVLSQDDLNGEEKANLASSIAQVGQPEDMVDLMRLIQADIERMRRGQAARAAGDQGPCGNGGWVSYAGWNVGSVMHLDPAGAEQVLIDLLPEPEYLHNVAVAMARDFLPKPERSFNRSLRYDLIWSARAGRAPQHDNEQRRTRFADTLNAEIKRLREQNQEGKSTDSLKELAKALAAVDGLDSAVVVLDVISMPGQWDQHIRLDAAEKLLRAGVILPTTTVFALVDSILEKRTENWMQDSDKHLLCHILSLCPFVDDLEVGMAKIRDVLSKRLLRGKELCELVTALGESRLDSAIDILYELASDEQTFEQCQDNFINAFGTLDTPRAHELLLGFVDPDICAIVLTRRPHHEKVLVKRLTELARRRPEVSARLQELCEFDLPELNRYVLSKVMNCIGTPEAFIANLNLIDDTKPSPVPQGIWNQIESTFIERRPYEQNTNTFTLHARASNELRVRLFRMALEDQKRRKSAFMLIGQIEQWRLEHGRPMGEPRHPDLASGQSWPPKGP